jgi:hypothetical protein
MDDSACNAEANQEHVDDFRCLHLYQSDLLASLVIVPENRASWAESCLILDPNSIFGSQPASERTPLYWRLLLCCRGDDIFAICTEG